MFRRRFLEELERAYSEERLRFFGEHAALADAAALTAWLAPLRACEWVVSRQIRKRSGGSHEE